jgi:hypothetical protein
MACNITTRHFDMMNAYYPRFINFWYHLMPLFWLKISRKNAPDWGSRKQKSWKQ